MVSTMYDFLSPLLYFYHHHFFYLLLAQAGAFITSLQSSYLSVSFIQPSLMSPYIPMDETNSSEDYAIQSWFGGVCVGLEGHGRVL